MYKRVGWLEGGGHFEKKMLTRMLVFARYELTSGRNSPNYERSPF
jgi:hypothetical protein